MNIRTRHMALIAYSALSAVILAKDLIIDPAQIIALLAPIGGMFVWDKIQSSKHPPAE